MPATVVHVRDPADPRLADFVGLTDAELRRRVELPRSGDLDDHGSFIVEGHLALDALLASPYPVRSVLVSDVQAPRVLPLLTGLASTAHAFVAPQAVVEATVGFRLHRGVVASAARLPDSDAAALIGTATRLLVLEGVNDHENLGSLFRNAAAFGVDGVLLDPSTADPLYRRSVRVSLGHALRVPFARLRPWPDGLEVIAAAGFTTISLTPDPTAPSIDDVATQLATQPAAKPALLLGAEGPGLTVGARAATRRQARIPMAPGVDSLNVATAAAVALHVLQRCIEPPPG